MSTITVTDIAGNPHRFEDVDGVEIQCGDLHVVAAQERGRPVTMGTFAAGHWSSWRRLADKPKALAHESHVHLADRAADLVE